MIIITCRVQQVGYLLGTDYCNNNKVASYSGVSDWVGQAMREARVKQVLELSKDCLIKIDN